jgi:hypothetical protein
VRLVASIQAGLAEDIGELFSRCRHGAHLSLPEFNAGQ